MPRERHVGRAARGACKAIALLVFLAACLPVQALVTALTRGPAAFRLPPLIHRGICRILQLETRVYGAPAPGRPVLWLSNHLSYLDIPALGGTLRAAFVAKREVRGWPLLGWMARLQRTVFISRDRRDVRDARRQVGHGLADAGALVLFPEGTSSDGRQVLPFRASLLPDVPGDATPDVVFQPVALSLQSVDGRQAKDQRARDTYAYHGDMQLARHLWCFLSGSGAVLDIHFLPPVVRKPGESRKPLAARIQCIVTDAATGGAARGDPVDAR